MQPLPRSPPLEQDADRAVRDKIEPTVLNQHNIRTTDVQSTYVSVCGLSGRRQRPLHLSGCNGPRHVHAQCPFVTPVIPTAQPSPHGDQRRGRTPLPPRRHAIRGGLDRIRAMARADFGDPEPASPLCRLDLACGSPDVGRHECSSWLTGHCHCKALASNSASPSPSTPPRGARGKRMTLPTPGRRSRSRSVVDGGRVSRGESPGRPVCVLPTSHRLDQGY